MEKSLHDLPTAASSERETSPGTLTRLKLFTKKLRGLTLSPVTRQVVWSVCVAGVAVALGVVLSFPAVALDSWAQHKDVLLTQNQAGWFASVVHLMSIPGSILGGVLMDSLGPRRLLLLLLPGLTASWLLILLTTHDPILLIVVRALQGVLGAGCVVSVYVYPCEVSEAHRRGVLGALPDTAFSLGFLLTYLLGAVTHWSTLVLLVPPCVFLPCIIAVALVPESPSWLLQHGKHEEARAVLLLARGPDCDIENELLTVKMKKLDNNDYDGPVGCPRFLITQPRYLLPVLTAITLIILKECTGQIVIVLSVVRIFKTAKAGVSPYWCSVLVCCARVVANMTSYPLLVHYQRRTILSVAAVVAGFSMMLIAYFFYSSTSGSWPNWVPVVSLLLFVGAYGCGVGPVVCLLATEIMPGAVRGLGSGLSCAVLYIMQFGFIFLATNADSNLYIYFWVYAAGCFILAGFTSLLPETRNKKLEQLEQFWQDVRLQPPTHTRWCMCRPVAHQYTLAEDKNNNNNNEHLIGSYKSYVIV
ncbi:facilitated trehalose transporter Tret1-like [Homarus americanus]|uniref:Facilitated trehalose transporter Tret1-like 14 n=1 Tax=Homarus americanus TaxID=6706 RepID=A0A8J5N1K4_HOMAM|nr:facilitated trehalose transporter Tret1-like [Homarus americanus]KAG7171486.1 Facilitated trehalose transporter Tret1-like 14 [Homarus americanus]